MLGSSINLIVPPPISPSPFLSLSRFSLPSFPATELLKATSRKLITATKAHSVSTMAAGEENVASLKRQLGKLFEVSLRAVAPDEPNVEPVVVPSAGRFGDYQCNNAMDLWSKIKGNGTAFRGPPSVGQAIMGNLPQSEIIESCSVAGPGFVNIVLSNNWMAKSFRSHPLILTSFRSGSVE